MNDVYIVYTLYIKTKSKPLFLCSPETLKDEERRDFPGGPIVKTSLPRQGVQV